MKKYIKVLHLTAAMLLTMTFTQLRAQSYFGYCTDEAIAASFSTSSTSSTMSVAICLPPETIKQCPGCNINGISAGLYTVSGVKTFSVWIREHLNSANIAEVPVEVSDLATGWNQIALPASIKAADYDTLYVGIDYKQSRMLTKAMGAAGEKGTPNSFWAATDGKWTDRCSSYKPACIRANISTDVNRQMSLADAFIESGRYQEAANVDGQEKPSREVSVAGMVQNTGNDPLTAFSIAWEAKTASATQSGIQHFDCSASFMQKVPFRFDIAPLASLVGNSNIQLHLTLQWPDGSTQDIVDGNGERTLYFDVLDSQAGRVSKSKAGVLVEQYTSFLNGFASFGQQHAAKAIAKYAESSSTPLVMITRHEGYGPADALRPKSASDYWAQAAFHGEGLNFAPAMTVNRHGEAISTTLPVDSLCQFIARHAEESPSHTWFESCDVRKTGTLQYELDVKIAYNSLSWGFDPVLVVCLVQDSLHIDKLTQKDYGYSDDDAEAGADMYERNVVLQFITPNYGTTLMLLSDPSAAPDVVEEGRVPVGDGTPLTTTLSFSVPDSSGNYSVAVWVCNWTDSDRSVECAKLIKLY
ncbi:MAG: hypothetical protein KBT20_00325 [Bacteroidales bacterium]|nr:hypothetical protein [Candidatus Liminaster caballi]